MNQPKAQLIGLNYSLGEEESYDEPDPETHDWVLKLVWLFDGTYGQKKGRYNASPFEDSNPFIIDLYTFQKWGELDGSSNIERVEKVVAKLYQGRRSQVNALLDIDAWCMTHVGKKVLVNHARSKPASVYSIQFFDHRKPVLCRDYNDQCLRASFTNPFFLVKRREDADNFCQSEPECYCADSERLRY